MPSAPRPSRWTHPAFVACATAVVFLAIALLHPGRESRTLRYALMWPSALALCALTVLGWRAAGHPRTSPRPWRWWGVGVALALVALWVPPFQSSDMRAYAQTGRLQTHYDVNPYVVVPSEVAGTERDPTFTTTYDVPCVYGFFFAHLAHGVVWVAGDDPAAVRLGFRLLALLATLGVGALLLLTWRDRPDEAVVAVHAWMWSPFVLIELVAHGHNDAWFGLWLVVALVAARAGRSLWVLPALVLAVLTKIVAVVALPFACVYLGRRHGRAKMLASASLALGVAALVSLPYVLDASAIRYERILAEWTRPSHSLTAALVDIVEALRKLVGGGPGITDLSQHVVRGVLLLGFAGVFVVRLRAALRNASYGAQDLVFDTVLLLFLLITVASAKFYPWYLCMVLPAALLRPRGDPLRVLTLWLTCSWLLAFTLRKSLILDFVVMTAAPIAWYLWRARRPGASADEAQAA